MNEIVYQGRLLCESECLKLHRLVGQMKRVQREGKTDSCTFRSNESSAAMRFTDWYLCVIMEAL